MAPSNNDLPAFEAALRTAGKDFQSGVYHSGKELTDAGMDLVEQLTAKAKSLKLTEVAKIIGALYNSMMSERPPEQSKVGAVLGGAANLMTDESDDDDVTDNYPGIDEILAKNKKDKEK